MGFVRLTERGSHLQAARGSGPRHRNRALSVPVGRGNWELLHHHSRQTTVDGKTNRRTPAVAAARPPALFVRCCVRI